MKKLPPAPPAAPPVYRPQPLPAVLQTKKTVQSKAAAAAKPEPLAKKTPSAPPAAYRPNPTPRVLQRKKIDNRAGAPPQITRRDPLSRAPAPALRTRASIVQRMEDRRHAYTVASVSKGEPPSGPSRSVFTGNGGEQLVIKDHGGCLNVYVDGKDVGYLTYMEETEEGRRRMRLMYIHITNQAWQGKKLSAGLIFMLCLKALHKGIDVICVGHPDANIKAYWEAMGFDYQGAQAKQYAINVKNKDFIPEDTPEEYRVRTLAPLQETVPTEAEGSVHALLAWAQRSFLSYWK